MSHAFVFPGQGSQAVGMGKELADAFAPAREVFEEVNDALNQNLSRLVWEGPFEDLTLTENAQPALMAVSMAVVRVLEAQGGFSLSSRATFMAGHSLGEYSALAAAGSLTLTDAARLLKTRGQAMQKAVPVGEGGMAALLGLELDVAEAVAREAAQDDVCEAANDNAPGQVVLSGTRAAIERAVVIAREKGAKRAILLPVSAPFHCSLMQPAAIVMDEVLQSTGIQAPGVRVVANVTAEAVEQPAHIRQYLVEQVTGRVRWRESVNYMMTHGTQTLTELGSGKVLSTMAKRINRSAVLAHVEKPDDVDAFLESL